MIDCVGNVSANVEHLIVGGGHINGVRDYRSYVIDMRESALLLAITEDGHCLAFHKLIHEDADDVAVAVTNVLALAVNVVWAENNILQAEHFMRDAQLLLHGLDARHVRGQLRVG